MKLIELDKNNTGRLFPVAKNWSTKEAVQATTKTKKKKGGRSKKKGQW